MSLFKRKPRFRYVEEEGTHWIETSFTGKALLTIPQLNKGSAFTHEEREAFGLLGKLPYQIETIEEQAARAYVQFQRFKSPLEKKIYLSGLQDTNEVLFYHLVSHHLSEMLPIIYTPTVGEAVQEYSREFRKPRGLYISYQDRHQIDEILSNRTNPDIDLVVVSDAEGILGIGDQGVGGIEISIAKLMVYTLCGGFHPGHGVPIYLDVGTNSSHLLNDPYYLGWRRERISGAQYEEFIDLFVQAFKRHYPNAFLHWEDLGRDNARRILERYKNEMCTFNDDMQGTGVVTLAALLAAIKASGTSIQDHRIAILGAGTAGLGVAEQMKSALMRAGMSEEEALQRFWLLDKEGLLVKGDAQVMPYQEEYARAPEDVRHWSAQNEGRGFNLADVVSHVQPTILIGASTAAGAFSEDIVRMMAAHTRRPIIFPLSNPTLKAEAHPEDLLHWTNGEVLLATGSPFAPVRFDGHLIKIAQCNNALAFPGIGMGVIASRAQRLTEEMLWEACQTLSAAAPVLENPKAGVLPDVADAPAISRQIAIAVVRVAQEQGLAGCDGDPQTLVDQILWSPNYLPYRPMK